MSRKEDVDTAIWGDEEFVDGLSPHAKLLYFWAFTNPLNGMAGLYKVPRSTMAAQTGLTGGEVEAALAELAERRFAFYEAGVMFVRARVKRLRQKSPQIAKSITGNLALISDRHPLKARWMEENRDHAFLAEEGHGWGIDTPSIPHRGPMDDDGVEPNPDTPSMPHGDPIDGVKGKGTGRGKGKGGSGGDGDEPPDDFPEHLNPALTEVVTVLRRIAAARDANHVTVAATARALASYPRRPHRKAAEDLEHWLVHGTGRNAKVRDVVGYYRNQLERRWQDAAASPPGQTPGNGSRFVAAINSRRAGGAAT
jgi:hypothetical protein